MPASSLVGLGIFSRPIREANASSRSLSSVCQNPVNLVNLVNPVNRPPPRSPRVDAFATLHPSGCLRQSFSLRSIILPCRAPCGSLIRSFQLLTLAGLLMQSFSATASIPERLPRPPGSRDTKSSLLMDFRRGAQRVPPVCFGMLLGSNGNRWRASRPVSTRPRRPCPLLLRF
jgi:hypothetical protein